MGRSGVFWVSGLGSPVSGLWRSRLTRNPLSLQACCATCCGPTRTKTSRAGERTTAASPSPSGRMWSASSLTATIWTSSAEPTRYQNPPFTMLPHFCQLSDGVWRPQVVEDGYEFFAKRQLVTLFSAPNYCGEFDNAGGMMSVDETLMCSFQVRHPLLPPTAGKAPGAAVTANPLLLRSRS